MRCISVQNPWASGMLVGINDVHNAREHTSYRGPCLVHVAPRYDDAGVKRMAKQAAILRGSDAGMVLSDLRNVIAGVVWIERSEDAADCQLSFAVGPVCWVLKDPLIFRKPIDYPPAMGLIDVADGIVEEAVATALPPRQWIAAYDAGRLDEAVARGEA